MTDRPNSWLLLAGSGNAALAALHVVIMAVGEPAYLYFGAARFAELAAQGSAWPATATAGIIVVLLVWSLYAFSGAGMFRRLPYVRTALWLIAGIYTLRGLVVVLDVARSVHGAAFPLRQTAFSAAALALGIVHAVGTYRLRGSPPEITARVA